MIAREDADDLERGDKVRGGSVIVSVLPSRWQSIGSVSARLIQEKTRERLAPRAGRATAINEESRYE